VFIPLLYLPALFNRAPGGCRQRGGVLKLLNFTVIYFVILSGAKDLALRFFVESGFGSASA